MDHIVSSEATAAQLAENFPAFFETQRFFTAF
jgi:hypothetical protein